MASEPRGSPSKDLKADPETPLFNISAVRFSRSSLGRSSGAADRPSRKLAAVAGYEAFARSGWFSYSQETNSRVGDVARRRSPTNTCTISRHDEQGERGGASSLHNVAHQKAKTHESSTAVFLSYRTCCPPIFSCRNGPFVCLTGIAAGLTSAGTSDNPVVDGGTLG